MLGTLINVGTVVVGSSVGLFFKNGLGKKMSETIFHILGVFTLFVGFQQALVSDDMLLLVLSLIVGGIIGQGLQIEERFEHFVSRFDPDKGEDGSRFTEGMMTAFMLFCVGTLTVVGCFQEGVSGDKKLILTKSVMDFFSSMALAAAFGRGVLFAAVPLFFYQTGLTVGAGFLQPILNEGMMHELFASGGLMLIALGLNILKLTKIRVLNLLPGIFVAVLFTWIAQYIGCYKTL